MRVLWHMRQADSRAGALLPVKAGSGILEIRRAYFDTDPGPRDALALGGVGANVLVKAMLRLPEL